MPNSTSLALLKPGEFAIIRSFSNIDLCNKLMEMGCLTGEIVSVVKTAPFGCPISIGLGGHELSLRKQEAEMVLVELVP